MHETTSTDELEIFLNDLGFKQREIQESLLKRACDQGLFEMSDDKEITLENVRLSDDPDGFSKFVGTIMSDLGMKRLVFNHKHQNPEAFRVLKAWYKETSIQIAQKAELEGLTSIELRGVRNTYNKAKGGMDHDIMTYKTTPLEAVNILLGE